MHPRMLAMRELNRRIGNLRDVRVAQVLHVGDEVEISFAAHPPFGVRLHGVIALRDRNVCHARLEAGIAHVPLTRYGRRAALAAGVDAEEYMELSLDDANARSRFRAVALRAEFLT